MVITVKRLTKKLSKMTITNNSMSNSDMEKLREETIRHVRCCLVIVKGALELKQLANDYRTFMNHPIPYKQLGYNSLEDFLCSVDSLIVRKQNGQVLVDAKPDPSSSHISDMVMRQKTSTKKKKVSSRPFQRLSDPKRWRPQHQARPSPKVNSYSASMRLAQHNQFVSTPTTTTTTNKSIKPMAPSSQRNINNNCSNTRNMERMQISPGPSSHNKENACERPQLPTPQPPAKKPLIADVPSFNGRVVKPIPQSLPSNGFKSSSTDKTPYSEKTNLSLVMSRAKTAIEQGKISIPMTLNNNIYNKTSVEQSSNFTSNRVSNFSTSDRVSNFTSDRVSNFTSDRVSNLTSDRTSNLTTSNLSSKNSKMSSHLQENQEEEKTFREHGIDVSEDLLRFTKFRKMEAPITTVKERWNKSSRKMQFDCKIKIDGMIYSSYPKDFHDRQAAEKYAARVALDKLLEKYGNTKRNSLPCSTDKDVLDRVPALIGKHFNGVWSWQVEADYKDIYQETLPSVWLKLVDDSPIITVEQFGDKYVCRVCTPEDKGKRAMAALSCDVSIPTSFAMFDERGFLFAKITCPISPGEIWCRQIGTEETAEFDKMTQDLNAFYTEQFETGVKEEMVNIIKGNYYAAWYEEWYRVKVLDIRPDGIRCLFVDRGDDAVVQPENVYRLHRRFAREKTQAFVCRLAGLEDLYDVTSDHIYELDGIDVTLEAVDLSSDGDDANKIVTVVMYDAESGLPCNKDLMNSIAIENATVILDLDKPLEVHVSHIGSKGNFFFQHRTPGFNILQNYMDELQKVPTIIERSTPFEITRDNCQDKMFLAKINNEDQQYRRVQVIDSPPSFEFAQVLFVDTGATCVVKVKDVKFYLLEDVSPTIASFPAQAILVKLQLEHDRFDQKKMMELLPEDASVLLRVHDTTTDIPEVRLFVRHANGLVSVNDSLSLQQYSRESTPQLSPTTSLKSPGKFTPPDSPNNVPSTGILASPPLPKSCEYYEVKIPFAVNPWNFFVQPLDSSVQLGDLMTRLQATFANRNVDPVNLKDIKAGNIYAAKHGDGPAYYRVCVLKTIYPSAIVVFYVDYGYYANLSYQNLYPIDKQFLSLPHQAIKAKLAGIKPIQEKWSVDDCKYFEKLVQSREYVSVMISMEKDELYPCDNVLKLKLIDTKTSKLDVLIGDLLIQKRIAVRE